MADALGVCFETMPPNHPTLLAWDGTSYGGSAYHGLKAGQWSDDTMMSSLIAESLVLEGTYSPADVSRRYLAWLESGDGRGMGKATRNALNRLRSGLPWTQSGIAGAEGNGTAMRAAPIGVFFRNNIQAVVEMAKVDADITHVSLAASQGSVAVAVTAALLSYGMSRDAILYKVMDWVPQSSMRQRLLLVRASMEEGWCDSSVPDEGPDRVKAVVSFLVSLGTKAHVLDTVPAALFAFLATNNYLDAVQAAIRAGGDTDTTAAITGAFAGIYYGREQVEPFLKDLESVEALTRLEDRLFREAPDLTGLPSV